jgi:hypothetical protein
MASTYSLAGSTQNQVCAQGKGYIPAPSYNLKPVIPLVYTTNAFTVSANNSGCVYTVPANGANATITLPVPQAGLNYKFVLSANGTHTVAIGTNSAATIIYGIGLTPVFAATTLVKAYAGAATATVPAAALLGDSVDLTSDGTNWYIFAQSQNNTTAFT